MTGSSCYRTRRNWSSQVQQISHIGMAASHSPNDNQAAPIGSARGYEQHHAPLTTRAKAEQAAARSHVYASSAVCVLALSCGDVV